MESTLLGPMGFTLENERQNKIRNHLKNSMHPTESSSTYTFSSARGGMSMDRYSLRREQKHQMHTHTLQEELNTSVFIMGEINRASLHALTVVFSPALCFLWCPWPDSTDTGARAQNGRPTEAQ